MTPVLFDDGPAAAPPDLGELLELVRTERVQAFRFPGGDLGVDASSLAFGDEPLAFRRSPRTRNGE